MFDKDILVYKYLVLYYGKYIMLKILNKYIYMKNFIKIVFWIE